MIKFFFFFLNPSPSSLFVGVQSLSHESTCFTHEDPNLRHEMREEFNSLFKDQTWSLVPHLPFI